MTSYTTVFILAPRRSGSTLLDNLLAEHPGVVSLGEIDKLRAYARGDRRLYDPKQPLICSCGADVAACPFWNRVENALGAPLADLSVQWPPPQFLRDAMPTARRLGLYAGLRTLALWPGAFRMRTTRRCLGAEATAADSWRLFDAIQRVTQADCIIDDSKSPYRYRTLWHTAKTRVLAVVLCRDYRAVTHSLMRRGLPLEQAIARWRQSVVLIEKMLDGIPADSVVRLTYEELCASPELAIGKLQRFLGLTPFEPSPIRSADTLHHISGSPSKFDPTRRAVRFDNSYLSAFDAAQLVYLRQMAGGCARRWGYD